MRSLRTFVLVAAAIFTVLLLAAATVLVRQAESAGRQQTRAQLVQTTRALSLALDGRLEAYRQTLVALSVSDAMRRGDIAEVERQARSAIRDPDVWFTLSDRRRPLINTRLPPGAALPSGTLPPQVWAELDSGHARTCNLTEGFVEPQVLCVDVPVMRGGRAEYKLSMMFKPRTLQRMLDDQQIPAGRLATIVDREGTVIWRNVAPERFVGRKATPDLLRQLAVRPQGIIQSHSLEGTPTEAAFSRSRASGWTFIIAVPRDQLAAGARKALRGGASIAGVLLAAALLTAFLVARALTHDIARLGLAARRIREGAPPAFERSQFEELDALSAILAQAISERDDSRERFALAQEVGGIGSWDWDSLRDEGRVSDTYKQMHGLSHVEGPLKFSQVLETIHPEDRSGYLERLAAARRRAEPSTNEYRVLNPDGSIRWVAAKGRPIFDDEGRIVGSIGIVRDATAEHEAAEAMQRLNQLLEREVEERTVERDRLWNIARDPFVIADSNGVWLAASPAWETLLGHPLHEFLGRTSEWLEHPDDIARTRSEDRRLAEGHVTERFENRFRARDGSYRWLSWTAVPEGGRFYSVARDVTAEKEQAAALKKAEEALRQSQKMESIGQITGGVAHDFNNLLMPILGTLDLLQQRGLPDARSERMVGNALEAAERARMLVQRLLAFARRQPLRAEAVDLVSCLEQMRPLLVTTLGPQVTLGIDPRGPLPPVSADVNQLELALLNLSVNAKDAMPDGGSLTITLSERQIISPAEGEPPPGRYVEIAIADTGVGMPPSVIERAIEPFFSTKGVGRGTGLGLSMVHGLAAQLGGGLLIESALGQGTTVRLWLRALENAEASTDPVQEPAPEVVKAGSVLLVDDEELARASTAEMLRAIGYQVLEADSAQAALEILESRPIDALVTDHLMPGISGTELARLVRRRWPDMQVLIISGYADVDDIAPDLPRLSKPFRRAELARAIEGMGRINAPLAD